MVLHRTLIAAAVLAATAPAWASTEEAARAVEEPAQADAAEPASDEGESVVVRDRAGESLTSFTHLTREDIARRPTEDGNITDLLKSNPAVQFSNHGDGSLQMGEIKPSNISIHGSVAYQNNYTLDGISTNSDLDPAEQTSVTTTRLGGSDEQGFYVDSRLIDSVTVYDHNIPASFGGFTGGVIDAQTRSWSGENHISVFGRMTKSAGAASTPIPRSTSARATRTSRSPPSSRPTSKRRPTASRANGALPTISASSWATPAASRRSRPFRCRAPESPSCPTIRTGPAGAFLRRRSRAARRRSAARPTTSSRRPRSTRRPGPRRVSRSPIRATSRRASSRRSPTPATRITTTAST